MNWENHLDTWINPNMGDVPLEAVNNLALKNLVTVMCDGGLSAKSIGNYVQVVKMVVASAVNEQGEELYPRKWNAEFIDMPAVSKPAAASANTYRRCCYCDSCSHEETEVFHILRSLRLSWIAIWRSLRNRHKECLLGLLHYRGPSKDLEKADSQFP